MAAPSKGNKRVAEDSPSTSKKPRTSKTASSTPAAAAATTAAAPSGPPTLPYKSSLVADEVDFPRGGGSSLTPYEFKEATNEARREADSAMLVEVRKTRLFGIL